ncbi:MAG TPA: hypothetical protein VFV66_34945 [Nonomuraea sp.]|nr:hypothetical protein [Nonomuraea sp.]
MKQWSPPMPVGYPGSIQSLGGFAAPLLAAASFTMTALLLPTASQVFARWTDAAMTLFVAAGLAHIAAVQAAIWARRYDTTPAELVMWHPDEVDGERPSAWLQGVQQGLLERSRVWSERARFAYHLGIALLLAGLAVATVPKGELTPSRWLLVSVAILGFVGEVLWITGSTFLDRDRRRSALLYVLTVMLAVTAAATEGAVGVATAMIVTGYHLVAYRLPAKIRERGYLLAIIAMPAWAMIGSGWARVLVAVTAALVCVVQIVKLIRLWRVERAELFH